LTIPRPCEPFLGRDQISATLVGDRKESSRDSTLRRGEARELFVP